MQRKILTRKEQRDKQSNSVAISVNLALHLRSLAYQVIVDRDSSKLQEFQQWVQYAPAEMKQQLLQYVDGLKVG